MDQPKTILLIEDNPASIKFITVHLNRNGYRTFVAENGFTGLQKAREIRPDLILLDIMLPDLDGHKLCRMIKFNRELKQIPVAMFTSRDTEEDAELAQRCGANAFILKTTHIDIILETVKRLIQQSVLKESDEGGPQA
jgi:two-component system, OmpR family, alkaline phosphatase synthesis response regulator PhoP